MKKKYDIIDMHGEYLTLYNNIERLKEQIDDAENDPNENPTGQKIYLMYSQLNVMEQYKVILIERMKLEIEE